MHRLYQKSTTALLPTIPIDSVGSGILTPLCSCTLDVKANDILIIAAQVEFTLPYTYNVNTGIQLNLGTNNGDISGSRLIAPIGMNLTPDMHHIDRQIFYIHQVTADFKGHLNLLGYSAASPTHANAGDYLCVGTTNIMLAYAVLPFGPALTDLSLISTIT